MLRDFVSPYSATVGRTAPEGGGRRRGQDQPRRVRHGLLHGELGPHGDEESLGPAPRARRLQRRLRRGRGRRAWRPSGWEATPADRSGSPPSFCGVYGLKPTWGAVSRFGLVAYASSLEVIGVMAKTVDMTETVFSLMRGQDPRDHSSLPWQPPAREEGPVGHRRSARVRRRAHAPRREEDPREARGRCSGSSATTCGRCPFPPSTTSSLPTTSSPPPRPAPTSPASTACATAIARRARTTPEAMTIASRTEGFGHEVKLRILLGTYVLRSGFQDEYYLRAQKIRTAIRMDFEKAFAGVDLVLMPVYPVPAFRAGKRGGRSRSPRSSPTSSPARPTSPACPRCPSPRRVENGLPIGMQFLAPPFAEELLFAACRQLEKVFPSPTRRASRRAGGRGVRVIPRPGGPHPASDPHQGLLRLPGRLRRRAEHERLPRLHGLPRGASHAERRGHAHGLPRGPGAELHPRPVGAVRAQELLLSRPSQELPDLPVPLPAGHRRLGGDRAAQAAASGCASARSTSRRTRAR